MLRRSPVKSVSEKALMLSYWALAPPFMAWRHQVIRHGTTLSAPVRTNRWRQPMKGGAKAQYDSIKAFSETDFTGDLRSIAVPTLVMHGDDDQIVPVADSAMLSSKLLPNATLKVYKGLPHGMCTTHAEVINPDLLAFLRA